jgi:hypothetical protein
MKQVKLIDVTLSKAQGKIVTIERAESVAESLLARKAYRGSGFGRYILESDKDKYFEELPEEEPKKKRTTRKKAAPKKEADAKKEEEDKAEAVEEDSEEA